MKKASRENHFHYNNSLQPLANKLRKNMTKSETCLWKYTLGGRQMMGYQFRRQRPILEYIVDFMCMKLLLIIEVDGISHEDAGAKERDQMRDQILEEVGFSVLRFHSWQVLTKIEDVSEEISTWIESKVETNSIE